METSKFQSTSKSTPEPGHLLDIIVEISNKKVIKKDYYYENGSFNNYGGAYTVSKPASEVLSWYSHGYQPLEINPLNLTNIW
jgi:hypothetical protein